jgi:hypothetical protein
MTRGFRIGVVLLSAFGTLAPVAVPAAQRHGEDEPAEFKRLVAVDAFYGNYIGIAGQPSPTYDVLSSLVRRKGGLKWVRRLIEKGTMPGQMYGLCGLYLLDKQAFAHAAISYAGQHTTIRVADSCFVWESVDVSEFLFPPATLREGSLPGPAFAAICEATR